MKAGEYPTDTEVGDFSYPYWKQFVIGATGLKLTEYPTDIVIIRKHFPLRYNAGAVV